MLDVVLGATFGCHLAHINLLIQNLDLQRTINIVHALHECEEMTASHPPAPAGLTEKVTVSAYLSMSITLNLSRTFESL